jgi:hypothetical protein
MWTQLGLKFSGLTAKTTAYQTIIAILTQHLSHLPFPEYHPLLSNNSLTTSGSDDRCNFDDTLKKAQLCVQNVLVALKIVSEDFINLQNQLSKPFPFIREMAISSDDASANAAGGGATMMRLSSMVSNLGKNVRKYAEVGYQRLGVLPSRVSDEDFAAFRNLIVDLCTKCQLLDKWYVFAKSMRGQLIALTSSGTNTTSLNVNIFDSTVYWTLIDELEKLLSQLHDIATFMRDVVCEILLRDVESLLERYLSKTRKSFSRLHWDELD